MTPQQLRREVTHFIALWMLVYPEDADHPSDVLRHTAAQRVLARERRGDRPFSEVSGWTREANR